MPLRASTFSSNGNFSNLKTTINRKKQTINFRMQAISGLQYTPNISMLNPNINYAFCFINYVSALLSSKKMTNSPEYCIYTSVMNACCVNKKGFQFLSFLFLLIPFSFSFFPLSFTTTLSRAPAFLFFCFSLVGEI